MGTESYLWRGQLSNLALAGMSKAADRINIRGGCGMFLFWLFSLLWFAYVDFLFWLFSLLWFAYVDFLFWLFSLLLFAYVDFLFWLFSLLWFAYVDLF
jgi:hypothetical protein